MTVFLILAEDCKARWKNIKDNYLKHKRKTKLGTGSSASYRPKWPLYDHLNFLEIVKSERLSLYAYILLFIYFYFILIFTAVIVLEPGLILLAPKILSLPVKTMKFQSMKSRTMNFQDMIMNHNILTCP